MTKTDNYYKDNLKPSVLNKMQLGDKRIIETDKFLVRRISGGFTYEYLNEGIVTASCFVSHKDMSTT